ncbi:hypothetical protein BKA93DRAFT_433025 [Sparassis latifolia]
MESALGPGQRRLLGELGQLTRLFTFPLVRYIPAEASGDKFQSVIWESSDLPDVPLEDHNSRCYYCLDDYEPPRKNSVQIAQVPETAAPEPLTQFPCGHVLHQDCAAAWMREHSECFLCKADILGPTDLPYPTDCLKENSDWSAVSNLIRSQHGIARRVVEVDLLYTMPAEPCDFAYFSADGQYLAVGGRYAGGHGRVIRTMTASKICTFTDDYLSACCFSPDETTLVTGNSRGGIKVGHAFVSNFAIQAISSHVRSRVAAHK